ncbi:MAG: UDP-N-acetylglucosamine 1-carboxyvinyltransferase [Planctomycetota bacterium]|nr:MAG: UDP-N-acetylglucosamine 1-carboxyvinyltransferase [Planctomycetota bacterium]
MEAFRILGGQRLDGEVRVDGAKNAALPAMAAALLGDEPLRLTGVPRVTDVTTLAAVLRHLHVAVSRENDILQLECDASRGEASQRFLAPQHLVARMRASFCVLGPLLALRGRAVVSLPGGCHLGDRPVDLHLRGLAALGADIRLERGHVVAESKRLRGAMLSMSGRHGPSVTGTANVLMAATLARGTTTIASAAREPEIVDLGRCLTKMGAKIEGLGTSTIEVHGVEQLGGATHQVMPDRIEAATLLAATAITQGQVTLRGAPVEALQSVLELLTDAGCQIDTTPDTIRLRSPERLQPICFTARPYPGVPTDVQPLLTALATLGGGTSTIEDQVFSARFRHLAELRRLGARIELEGPRAKVRGVEQLTGAHVCATDLRAGAALVLAGLAAQGETLVHDVAPIDRGHERLEAKLSRVGADIERVPSQRRPTLLRNRQRARERAAVAARSAPR